MPGVNSTADELKPNGAHTNSIYTHTCTHTWFVDSTYSLSCAQYKSFRQMSSVCLVRWIRAGVTALPSLPFKSISYVMTRRPCRDTPPDLQLLTAPSCRHPQPCDACISRASTGGGTQSGISEHAMARVPWCALGRRPSSAQSSVGDFRTIDCRSRRLRGRGDLEKSPRSLLNGG